MFQQMLAVPAMRAVRSEAKTGEMLGAGALEMLIDMAPTETIDLSPAEKLVETRLKAESLNARGPEGEEMTSHENRNAGLPSRIKGRVITVLSQSGRERPTRARWFSPFKLNVLAVLAFAYLICLPLQGQNITADVLGTVSDPGGAVVANATVTVQDMGTNAARTTQTNESGDFLFSLLPVGTYTVTVQAPGFKPYKIVGFKASAGDRLRMDVKLELGGSTQTVEVQASAEIVQTDSSSVGATVAQQAVEDMPLNGRNLTNLVTLQPGVNAGLPSSTTNGSRPDDRRQSSEVSANGQKEYFNDNVLDGIDNNERFYGLGGVKPSVDAVQEVKVQTGNFTADVGRAAGAVVQVITKSGTNQFHGGVYEFFRNDIFDAKEYFTPAGARNQKWRQNQFGGSLGGPIRKDKLFFFGSAEEFRQVQGINSPIQIVPSAADRAFVASTPIVLDPASAAIGKAIFNLFPDPNVGSTGFVSSPSRTQNFTTIDARVDQQVSANDQLFVRYSYNPTKSFFPSFFPKKNGINPVGAGFVANGQFPGTNTSAAQGGQVNYTHIFSPSLLMQLRAGFFRVSIDSEPVDSGSNAGKALNIPNSNIAADPRATGMPSFHFLGGTADLGDQIAYPILNTGNNYQVNGDLIYNRGMHSVKIGAALIRRQLNYLQDFQPQGWFFFAPIPLPFLPAGTNSVDAVDMALGFAPVVVIRQNMYEKEYLRSWEPTVYAQDDWHLRPWLTLNLGLRYDVYTPMTDAKNRISNFDLSTLTFIQGGTGGRSTDYGDISPRVGFAAQLHHGLVIHGGYGLVFYPGDISGSLTLFNPPFNAGVACSVLSNSCPSDANGNPTAGTLALGPPPSPATIPVNWITTPGAGLTLIAKQKDLRSPYLHQYNLTLQKQFGENVFTVGYVGSVGRRQGLSSGWDANLPEPDANGAIALSDGAVPHFYTKLSGVGNIQEFVNGASSNYNAMQLVFDRRITKGLRANANYTWAHGLSNFTGFENQGAPITWKHNYLYEYGNSDINVKQRLALTATYDVPLGKSLNGAGALLLKGWTLSSSGFWQEGLPFTVYTSNKPNGAYGDLTTGMRVNVNRGQSYYASDKSISGWLNNGAYTDPMKTATATTYTLGNERANQLYGPSIRQFDLAAFKEIPVKEQLRVQLRAECFNLSNTANFAPPVNDLNATNFGEINNINYGMFPRVFQFALKLSF